MARVAVVVRLQTPEVQRPTLLVVNALKKIGNKISGGGRTSASPCSHSRIVGGYIAGDQSVGALDRFLAMLPQEPGKRRRLGISEREDVVGNEAVEPPPPTKHCHAP